MESPIGHHAVLGKFTSMPTPILTSQAPNTWVIQQPNSGVSLQGTVQVPGDKSISHRALMLGALATGETQIQGLLLGEDPRSTASCFQAMGAEISELNSELWVLSS